MMTKEEINASILGSIVGWLTCLTPSCLRRDTGGDRNSRTEIGEQGDYT